MRKRPLALAISALTLFAILAMQGTTAAEGDIYGNRMSYAEATALQLASVGGNLLINGNMDQLGFYWRPTNHYVAGMWFEWWADNGTIPEYIDGGHPYHNACYPMPADGKCHNSTTGVYNSSQGYILWGAAFKAGIYQSVPNIEPCTLYTFEMYNRNDSNTYAARVAIDPTGWIITRLGNSKPENCPPDGKSRCPDPYIGDDHGFPGTAVWSAPSYHNAYTWAPISVTTESVANTVSVWTYAGPDYSGSQSTYWDNGSLVQVPFPGGKLPAPSTWTPSGYLQNFVTEYTTPTLTIRWTTIEPASTQILYSVTSPVITPTEAMTYTAYFPAIHQSKRLPYVDTHPTTIHEATIPGLAAGDVVRFIALSRRVTGASCSTETSYPYQVTIDSEQTLQQRSQLDPTQAAALYTQ